MKRPNCWALLFCVFTQFGAFQLVRIEVEHLPEKCGFSKCTEPDQNKLNVHLVPHTHDDVGWLKTVDQYYYGSQTLIQNAGVQYILDSVVQALVRNKDRRFIYVETAFFSKWWKEQDQQTRDIVQELVRTGQLEFINGGWCMNDEANTHYSAIIDQMTLGLAFLNETFGQCGTPRVAWQIDPFGHSREQASLFAQMNFDGLFFSRLDFEDQIYRRTKKTLEHVWHGSDDLGASSDLFTSVINHGYGPPDGFNWDLIGGVDEPVIDNPDSEAYNVDEIVRKFVDVSLEYQKNYATNNILFPMGEDFHYQSANILYKNMDKLIKHVNARQDKVKVFYSTPSCYLKALHDTGYVFHAKGDDFFPYASDPNAVWTGYFTSRPALKRMERVGNNWLQACKQIDVLALNNGKFTTKLEVLKEAMAIMQHHDAVAGTEKQKVAYDYAKLLQIGLDQCKQIISDGLNSLVSRGKSHSMTSDYLFCDLLNTSSCAATENYRNLVVTLFNPFSHPLEHHSVRLPVMYKRGQSIEVLDDRQNPVVSTLMPIPSWVKSIPGRTGNATYELLFDIPVIPPLGFISYFIVRTDTSNSNSAVEASRVLITKPTVLEQGSRTIHFNATGALEAITVNGKKFLLQSDFHYYEGHTGNNKGFVNRSSGAYIFRPKEQRPLSAGKLLQSVLLSDSRRDLYEVQQRYDSFVHQSIRLYPNKAFIEFDWFVDSIPIADKVGKEVVVRYSTQLASNRTFYTDSNGRQILKRVWNYRPSWEYVVFEPIASNYYPVNSRIFIRDESSDAQMTILNDRSQGGTSAQDGQIELMLHRRLLNDDAFGVAEALNETGPNGEGLVVRGRHFLLLDKIAPSTRRHRQLGQQLYLEPLVAFMPKYNIRKYPPVYRTFFSALQDLSLPPNVNLLTIEQWRPNQILIRLEHFYQLNEDPILSQKATVRLDLPETARIEELTLGANQNVKEYNNRLQFKYQPNRNSQAFNKRFILHANASEIILEPMQIRTFLLIMN